MNISRVMAEMWAAQAVISGLLSLPSILLLRHRAKWYWWELSAFILPFTTWAVLFLSNDKGKTLGNIVEWFPLILAIPIAVTVRGRLGHIEKRLTLSISLLTALCLVAAACFFFTPGLKE